MIEQYQAIGSALVATVPSGYLKARVVSRVTDDTADVEVRYTDSSGEDRNIAMATPQAIAVSDALIDLRQMMKQDGKDPWSRAVFTMTPDGKFNLEVSYDD